MPVVIDARVAFAKIRALRLGIEQEPAMRAVGLALMSWVDRNFKQGGIESPWRPLSPNTVAARRKGSSAILQDTGRLKQSWTRAAGNPRVMGDVVFITSNVKYAEFHENGAGPYIIKPRRAQVLRFMTANGPRFARFVRHPGLPARKMTPSPGVVQDITARTVQSIVDRAEAAANKL
ncbi:MAG: hypothetical protein HC889_00680 [Synechococcaceae cyanobacterium SM1_2_3]|nr:hypothetical protein [Synechococcaceae cyanobacterium SM1_2_3]